ARQHGTCPIVCTAHRAAPHRTAPHRTEERTMSSPDRPPTNARAASASDRHAPPPRVPTALRWLVVGVGVSIGLLILLPVLMLIRRTALAATIEREAPSTLSEQWMGWIVVFVLVYAVVLHLLCSILLLW